MDKPKAGKNPLGELCKCVCHSMYGVNHMLPCCFPSRKQLQEILGHLTDEDLEKIKEKK